MRKLLLLCMSRVLLSATCLANSAKEQKGDIIPTPLWQTGKGGHDTGHPHAPSLNLFEAYVDTDLEVMVVSTRLDVGYVSVTLENYLAGTYVSTGFDSSDVAVLPFNGTSGLWQVTFTLASGEEYEGEFTL